MPQVTGKAGLTLSGHAGLRYFASFYLYFMQGIPAGFALTALAGYLANQGADPGIIGSFIAITGLPWTFQFVWGPLIDRFQYSTMGHRKHWLVLAQLLAFLASLLLLFVTDPVHQLTGLGLVFFLHSTFASIQDAAADAMIIDIVPPKERGRANAFMRGGFLVGMAFGSAVLSVMLHRFGFAWAVALQSSLLLFFTIVTFFIRLRPGDTLLPGHEDQKREAEHQPSLRMVFSKIAEGFTMPRNLSYFLLVVVVYFCFSVFIRAYSFSLIRDYGWSDQKLSVLQGGWGMLLMLVVVLLGGRLSDRVGARRLQQAVMFCFALFLLIFNGLSAYWSHNNVTTTGLIIWNFADPLFSVACFPIIMGLCVKPVEGSQFTAYMALINLCDVLGSYVSGWSLHVMKPFQLGLICGAVVLLAWMLFNRIQRKYGFDALFVPPTPAI